jgi:hypothetical protein
MGGNSAQSVLKNYNISFNCFYFIRIKIITFKKRFASDWFDNI